MSGGPEHGIAAAVERTVRDHAALVADVARGRPGAWGALAARGIVTFRDQAGRKPTDEERRAIWAGLWARAHVKPPQGDGPS